jgi:hypothetical protein
MHQQNLRKRATIGGGSVGFAMTALAYMLKTKPNTPRLIDPSVKHQPRVSFASIMLGAACLSVE